MLRQTCLMKNIRVNISFLWCEGPREECHLTCPRLTNADLRFKWANKPWPMSYEHETFAKSSTYNRIDKKHLLGPTPNG